MFIQVWHLQSLEGQGTRHLFSRKVSPGSEETKLFYKKRLQLQGPGMCLPLGHAFPMPGPPMCWVHTDARHLHGGERQERLNT